MRYLYFQEIDSQKSWLCYIFVMQKKILIIGPSWIGDIVMAQVLFKVIKQNEPNSKIHVLAPSWSAPLLERMEEVERVLISPFKHGHLGAGKAEFV